MGPRFLCLLAPLGLAAALAGCALHYYDAESGAEHVWGVGHMVMKATLPQGQQAIVRGTTLLGLGVGNGDGQFYITFGWDKRQRLDILDGNTALKLQGPMGDLLNVRLGPLPPEILRRPQSPDKEGR